jgi:hypothetical protein
VGLIDLGELTDDEADVRCLDVDDGAPLAEVVRVGALPGDAECASKAPRAEQSDCAVRKSADRNRLVRVRDARDHVAVARQLFEQGGVEVRRVGGRREDEDRKRAALGVDRSLVDTVHADARRAEPPNGPEEAPPAGKVARGPRSGRRGGRVPDPDAEPPPRFAPSVRVEPLLVGEIERDPSDPMRARRGRERTVACHGLHSA